MAWKKKSAWKKMLGSKSGLGNFLEIEKVDLGLFAKTKRRRRRKLDWKRLIREV